MKYPTNIEITIAFAAWLFDIDEASVVNRKATPQGMLAAQLL
jgi:hypothetical protein